MAGEATYMCGVPFEGNTLQLGQQVGGGMKIC